MKNTRNVNEAAAASEAALHGYTSREWKRLSEEESTEKKKLYRLTLVCVVLTALIVFLFYLLYCTAFRSRDHELLIPFERSSSVYGFTGYGDRSERADPFAQELCVTDTDVNLASTSLTSLSAGLFDLREKEVVYAKDVFTKRSPASLTKVMTALVTLRYGNLEDQVLVTETSLDIEYGSSVCNIQVGDTLTLKQLLYGMMIASGNDAAMMIAEHVGGSVENFVQMMNDEARRLGCTRTQFSNPHGLTAEDHYTCVYDLYLMFDAALEYDIFEDIIHRSNYYAEYTGADGNPAAVTWETTNHYFTGAADAPENVIVYGGKTGTTEDAGACLVLLVKDLYGNPHISVILHSADKEILYTDMNNLISLVEEE